MDKNNNTRKRILGKIILVFIAILYLLIFMYVTHRYINANRYWDIELASTNLNANLGQVFTVKVNLKNKMYFPVSSNDGYFVSYHILTEDGHMYTFDNERTVFEEIKPGLSREVDVLIKAPNASGKYIIEIDIVKEGEYWFSDRGEKTGLLYLTVQ